MVDYEVNSLYHTSPNYAIYLRKSRADIEAEKVEQYDTLSKHYSILMDLAVKDGYNVTDIYREIVSGDSIKARPEMQRLLQAVKDGKYAGVLVTEVSRLGRGNSTDQGIISDAFLKSGTKIITPRKIYDTLQDSDQDFFDFELFMARQEYKYIKRRLIAGKRQSAMSGQFIGSIPPYGFDKTVIDKKKTIVPNDDMKYVMMLFDYFNQGHSYHECCKYLDSIGAKARYISEWSTQTVKRILNNPAYIGKAKVKDAYVDGVWEPVMPEETFYQRKGAVPKIKPKLRLLNKYAGLFVCQKCGRTLTYKQGWYYHDSKYIPPCYVPSITSKKLDECVIRKLKEAISDFEIKSKQGQREVTDYSPNIADAKKQLRSIYDRYEKGIYDDEEFLARRSEIRDRIEQLEALQKAEEEKPIIDYAETVSTIHALIDTISNKEIPAEQINIFLKSFIKKIIYYREDGKSEPSIKIEFIP